MEYKFTKQNFETEVLQSEIPVLVDFYADWCGPCKMLGPVLAEISEEMTDVDFFGLDVDENPVPSVNYGIHSVPTLILFKDGLEVDRMIGFTPKEDLVNWIEENR